MKGQELVIHEEDVINIADKTFIKVECGFTSSGRRAVMQRFYTGETSTESRKAFEQSILDIKIARRMATFKLAKDGEGGEGAGKVARWSWSDRQQTKRVKELASIDAIEELVEVELPKIGTCPSIKMTLKAETDLRSSLVMELSDTNLEYLIACYGAHKAKKAEASSSSEAIVWVASGVWKATRMQDAELYVRVVLC